MSGECENKIIVERENFDYQRLYNLGGFLAARGDFSQEQTLIVTACEEKPLETVETLICAGAAAGGGHAVRLFSRSFDEFIKAMRFLDADYGVYISGGERFVCGCLRAGAKEIHNFERDFEKYLAPRSFKAGKISSGINLPWQS